MPTMLLEDELSNETIPPPEEQAPVDAPDQTVMSLPPEQAAPAPPPPDQAPPSGGAGTRLLDNELSTEAAAPAAPPPDQTQPSGPPPVAPPGAIQQATDALGSLISPITEALPEPVRNFTDIVGQPVGGAIEAGQNIGAELMQGDVPGAIGAALTPLSAGQAHGYETTGTRVAAGQPAIPSLGEMIADPGQAQGWLSGVMATYGPTPAFTGITEEDWFQGLPADQQSALAAQGGTAVTEAYLDAVGSSDVPPPQLSNPFDAATSGNPLERAAQVVGAIPQFGAGWLQSQQQGTLGPFLLGQAQGIASDPLSFVPGVVEEKLFGGVGKALGAAARKIPGVGELGDLTTEEAARLQGEQVASATGEHLQSMQAALPDTSAYDRVPTPEEGPSPVAAAPEPSPVPEGPSAASMSPDTNEVTVRHVPTEHGGIYEAQRGGEMIAQAKTMAELAVDYPDLVDPTGSIDAVTMSRMRATVVDQRTLARKTAAAQPTAASRSTTSPTTGVTSTSPMEHPLTVPLSRQLVARGLSDYRLQVVNRLSDVLPPDQLAQLDGFAPVAMHDPVRKLITVSLDHADPNSYADLGLSQAEGLRIRTSALLDHEVVHAIRHLNLFNPDEWHALVGAAVEQKISGQMRGADGQFLQPYRNLSPEQFQEEMVAHLYQAFREGRLLADTPAVGLMERLRAFLAGLGASLRNSYPETVLQRIESGEIGGRPRGTEPGRFTEPDFASQIGKAGEEPEAPVQFAAVRRAPTLDNPSTEKIPEPTDAPHTASVAGDDPKFHLENLPNLVGTPGPGAPNLTDARLRQLFDQAAATYPALASKRTGATLPSAQLIHTALSRDFSNLLFFEDGATTLRDNVNLPTQDMNVLMNLLGATSGGAEPRVNFRRTLGSMSEHLQGRPIRTPGTTPEAVRDATRLDHLQSPKYFEYSTSFKYLDDLITTPPGVTLDRHLARPFGLPETSLSGDTYRGLATFMDSLRDEINTTNPGPPLQSWQIGQALWNELRGSGPEGDLLSRHMADALAEMRSAGVPFGVDGKMTHATFFDPRMIDLFGSTSSLYSRMPYLTFSERFAHGVVGRAYDVAATLPPVQQAAFHAAVTAPFQRALTRDVMPLLRQALAEGDTVSTRSIDFGTVRGAAGAEGFEAATTLPFGGLQRGRTPWQGNPTLAAGGLANHLGLSHVEAQQLLPTNRRMAETPAELAQYRQSLSYDLFFRDARAVTPEAMDRFSATSGYRVRRTTEPTGGVTVVLETVDGQIADEGRVLAGLEAAWPDPLLQVEMRDIVRESQNIRSEDYPAIKARWIDAQHHAIQTGGPERAVAARRELDAYLQFETRADTLRADWETAARTFLGESDPSLYNAADPVRDTTPAVIPTGPVELRKQAAAQKLRYAAKAAYSGTDDAFQQFNEETRPYDPHLYHGVQNSAAATELLKQSADGQFLFRDGSRPVGYTVGELTEKVMGDINTWAQGFDAAGKPLEWTRGTRKDAQAWQTFNKQFNPNGDLDTASIAYGPEAAGAKTTNAENRVQLANHVLEDAIAKSAPPVKRTALGGAFSTYTNAIRQAMLFNYLNVPRYMLQNLTTNTINIGVRGGGLKPAADVWTNLHEMTRIYGNQKDMSPTTLNMLEKRTGQSRPNIQQTQRRYFDRISVNDTPKILDIPLRVIAPESVRFLASVPDQLARESVGTHAVFEGYRKLNEQLVPQIHDTLRKQPGLQAFLPPSRKIQQVVGDFLNEHRTLEDPTTGMPQRTLLGRTAKFDPTWHPDDLKAYLKEHLYEGASSQPDPANLNRALNTLLSQHKDAVRDIWDTADTTVDHALFSWRDTKGDALLGKATLFHYYSSRQGGFYVSEALKHPWIASAYGRAMAEMEAQNKELGGPQWLTGFFQFANSVGGFTSFWSPFDWAHTVMTMADWQEGEDASAYTDLTELGKKFQMMPFFIHPAIQMVAYDLGLLGPDYRTPPLLGVETFAGKAATLLNLANSQDAPFMGIFNAMGIGVDAAGNKVPIAPRPLQDLYARAGHYISAALQPLTGLNPVEDSPSVGSMVRNVQTIGEQEVRLTHPTWDSHRVMTYVNDVLNDPGNPEYRSWYASASTVPFQMSGNVPQPFAAMARLASPFGITTMPEQRAIDTMEGFTPSGFLPPRVLPDDPDARKIIGEEAKYGASKTIEGRRLVQWDIDYNALVPPDLVQARYTASDISGSKLPDGQITINGTVYTNEYLAELSGTGRHDVRAAYLAEQGYDETDLTRSYDTQSEFLADHPDYAQYKQWVKLAGQYEGPYDPNKPADAPADPGVQQFVMELAQQNPSFAQYFQSQMINHETGEIKWGAVFGSDAYLAAQGERPSVYSPMSGNEPSRAAGGYPGIPGISPDQPILGQVRVMAETPLFHSPTDADQSYYDKPPLRVIDPSYAGPIQVIDPMTDANAGRPLEEQLVKVSVGDSVGYVNAVLLQNASPSRPVPSSTTPNGNSGVVQGGGLAGVAGGIAQGIGNTLGAVGGAIGSLIGIGPNRNIPAQPTNITPVGFPHTPTEHAISEQPDAKYGLSSWSEGGMPKSMVDQIIPDGSGKIGWEFRDNVPADWYGNYFTPATGGHGTEHPGVDLWGVEGVTKVATPVSGQVVCTSSDSGESGVNGFGCGAFYDDHKGVGKIEVQLDNKNQSLIFGHMQSSDVLYGRHVDAGTDVGTMGWSNQPHTHVEARVWCGNGTYQIVDPTLMLNGSYDNYRC